jgi:2-dehydro-3-deoxygalactonokinase
MHIFFSNRDPPALTEPQPFLAGVDWGTTRLRLWIMSAGGHVLAERRSDRGMATISAGGFADVLETELDAAGAPSGLPALICGMAGSRQGWIEVPYLEVPQPLDALSGGATRVSDTARQVLILPGLAQASSGAEDVMRGEETQIAGATALLEKGTHTVCLPGTHSKWAEVTDGTVTGFSTWLTGEMFALACEHSILRHSVGAQRAVDAGNPVFLERLRDSLRRPEALLSRLFSIRASGLLSGLSETDAAAALSGHLIGTEIAGASRHLRDREAPVLLVASGPITPLYEAALREAGLRPELHDAETAVRAGLLRAARNCL